MVRKSRLPPLVVPKIDYLARPVKIERTQEQIKQLEEMEIKMKKEVPKVCPMRKPGVNDEECLACGS